jgi:hypothetical protein
LAIFLDNPMGIVRRHADVGLGLVYQNNGRLYLLLGTRMAAIYTNMM